MDTMPRSAKPWKRGPGFCKTCKATDQAVPLSVSAIWQLDTRNNRDFGGAMIHFVVDGVSGAI
jgi:hypothetical protein